MHVQTNNGAFDVPVPLGLRDSKAHTVFAYGLDSNGGPSASLGTDKTFTCAPPALPAKGIKRWVVNPKALAAWKFDPLLDIAREPQTVADGVPKGPDMPAAPLAVIADGPEVYVIDGNVRRHVQNPTSLKDWQLTTTKWSGAQLTAIPEGDPWPLVPFVFEGSAAPEVWVLDYAGNTPTTDVPPTGSMNQEPTPNGPSASSGGCNTSSGTPDGSIAALLALAALLRRRATSVRACRS
jgi:MYXO-CTERM domain-containing protein